jgi:hypothetical protein
MSLLEVFATSDRIAAFVLVFLFCCALQSAILAACFLNSRAQSSNCLFLLSPFIDISFSSTKVSGSGGAGGGLNFQISIISCSFLVCSSIALAFTMFDS